MAALALLALSLSVPRAQVVPCTAARAQAVVSRFVGAFDAADPQELDRVLAPTGEFVAYTFDGRVLWDRPAIVESLIEEHDAGVRLQLTRFRFNGANAAYGNFEFSLLVEQNGDADLYDGKGTSICNSDGTDVLAVWAMGREQKSRVPGEPRARIVRNYLRSAQ